MFNLKGSYALGAAELLAALGIITSIIWSVLSQQHQDEWERKVKTIEALDKRDPAIFAYINKRTVHAIAPNVLLDSIKNNDSLRHIISKQLRFFEDISIGSNIGVYELDVVKRYVGHTFVDFNARMQPYIIERRKSQRNPNLYIEYDECARKMRLME